MESPSLTSKALWWIVRRGCRGLRLTKMQAPHPLWSWGWNSPPRQRQLLSPSYLSKNHKISCFTFAYHHQGILPNSVRGSSTPSYWSYSMLSPRKNALPKSSPTPRKLLALCILIDSFFNYTNLDKIIFIFFFGTTLGFNHIFIYFIIILYHFNNSRFTNLMRPFQI